MSTINFGQPSRRLSPCSSGSSRSLVACVAWCCDERPRCPSQHTTMHALALTLSTDSICFGGVEHDCDRYGLDQQPPAPSACLDFFGWRATRLVCLLVPTWQPVLHYQEGYDFYDSVPSSISILCHCSLAHTAPSLSALLRTSNSNRTAFFAPTASLDLLLFAFACTCFDDSTSSVT